MFFACCPKFYGTQKNNWAVWNFFLPYHVGQIIKAERNFTCAQNFWHSGKTLMLEENSCFFFSTGCLIKCGADWGFLFCPIILGIKVERLERSHFCPNSHARWKDD